MKIEKRTYADRREYLIAAVAKRRRELKKRVVSSIKAEHVYVVATINMLAFLIFIISMPLQKNLGLVVKV